MATLPFEPQSADPRALGGDLGGSKDGFLARSL